MGARDVFAGIIALFIGLAGIADIYGISILPFPLAIISVFLTTGVTLALFGAITIIGIVLIFSGASARKIEVIVQGEGARAKLRDLEFVVLGYASQGKSESEIATLTGVEPKVVIEKIRKLRKEGYLTQDNRLTEKGYVALKPGETIVVRE